MERFSILQTSSITRGFTPGCSHRSYPFLERWEVTATVVGDSANGTKRRVAPSSASMLPPSMSYYPAVQIQSSLFKRECHRRMRAQIRELRDHVFAHEPVELGARRVEMVRRVDRFWRHLNGAASSQPPGDGQGTCSAKWRPSRRSRKWPQITMSCTPSTATAYSTVAETPPGSGPYEGTMLPALRITNNSPGSRCVRSSGTTRLSEQVTNSAFGFCAVASCLKSSTRCRIDFSLKTQEAVDDVTHGVLQVQ